MNDTNTPKPGTFVPGDPRCGRRKGSKNKLTIAKEKLRADAIKLMNEKLPKNAFKGDAVEFLQLVYRSRDFDFETRMEAAEKAAPYERAKKTETTIDDKRHYVAEMPAMPKDLDEWKREYMRPGPKDPTADAEWRERVKASRFPG